MIRLAVSITMLALWPGMQPLALAEAEESGGPEVAEAPAESGDAPGESVPGADAEEPVVGPGAEDFSQAEDLQALARQQSEAGQHAAAAASLQREIELVEMQRGVYEPGLAPLLAMLGEELMSAGRNEEAIEALRRAQHIVHRHDGVYSLDQLQYVARIADSFIGMNQLAEADRHKRFSYFVNERQYGPDSPELVPAILDLAKWYRRTGHVREARRLYQRAVEVIEKTHGPEHPALMEPLLGLGMTTRKKGQYRKQREQALTRMVGIAANHPDLDTANRAASWANLGDFYILVNDRKRAAEAYGQGWDILNADPSLSEAEAGLFAEPRILNFPQRIYLIANTPGTPIDGYQRDLEEFSLDLEFDVSIGADGQPLAVKIIDAKANAATRRQLRRYVREARFRPRVVDGKPVRTDNFRFKERVTIIRPTS